ncbi:hypothetical protein EAI_08469 [Harpegnathos saltator]|uniref:Uncharacterized protein n=1 Tax=Harpegnathos saltator TaxID=610380 RepID=E2C513_HARSA|nr:hypothetical protein EAI_08469 [Harpegnathos saltator]
MASSPTSIENQIDSFLEQFKRSASRAMEDTGQHPPPPVPSGYNACGSSSISHSRSGNLDLEMLDAAGRERLMCGRPPLRDRVLLDVAAVYIGIDQKEPSCNFDEALPRARCNVAGASRGELSSVKRRGAVHIRLVSVYGDVIDCKWSGEIKYPIVSYPLPASAAPRRNFEYALRNTH